jgi:hypothetical protein
MSFDDQSVDPGKFGAKGIGLPLAVVMLWSVWAAPGSSRRLAMPYRAGFAAMLFTLAAFLLYQAGQQTVAILFLVVSVASMLVGYLTEG